MVNASTEAAWRDFWGDPNRRSNPYKSPPPPGVTYAKGYHRGEDLQALGSSDQIPVLRSGSVVAAYRLSLTGFSVAIDAGNGQFDIYCHLFEDDAVKSGWLSSGDRVARMAAANESPGTAWGGRHVHFVVSDNAFGASSSYADFDPRPIIVAALANGGVSGPTPGGSMKGIMETIVAAPNGTVVHIYPGGKHNFGSVSEYNTFRDQVNFLRSRGASNLMPLPDLAQVPNVTWPTFEYLCKYVGAPIS
ncbi:hypothetical protein [Microbacterium sp.]|uniref:hypothetical protein n=1 Tax=Microbacterium sp. TaxID=51671 RepID=UPI003241D76B